MKSCLKETKSFFIKFSYFFKIGFHHYQVNDAYLRQQREPDNCPPDNCTPDNCPQDNCPPDNFPPKIATLEIVPQIISPRTIGAQTIAPQNNWLLICTPE